MNANAPHRLVAVVALLLVGASVGTAAVAAQSGGGSGSGEPTAAERLMGSVAATEVEVEGDIDRRAFGLAVAGAATNESKAEVVADRLNRTRERLDELEARHERLREARENGSISNATYRREMTRLAAQVGETREMLNETETESAGLPVEALERKGINATAIQRLKANASNLTGPEVAAIARSIAGPGVGRPAHAGPPDDRGPGGERGPPADAGPPDEADDDGAENESDERGPPANAGPPEDRRDDDSDEAETPEDEAETPEGEEAETPEGEEAETPEDEEAETPEGEAGEDDDDSSGAAPENPGRGR